MAVSSPKGEMPCESWKPRISANTGSLNRYGTEWRTGTAFREQCAVAAALVAGEVEARAEFDVAGQVVRQIQHLVPGIDVGGRMHQCAAAVVVERFIDTHRTLDRSDADHAAVGAMFEDEDVVALLNEMFCRNDAYPRARRSSRTLGCP